jgi:hypothetical protein
VNGVFKAERERFGEKRKSGARPMREVGWKENEDGRLYSMRALRKDVVE